MIPYVEAVLLSEASLTSSGAWPEAADSAEAVIDSCRPRGQTGRRGAFWEACCGVLDVRWEVGRLSSV